MKSEARPRRFIMADRFLQYLTGDYWETIFRIVSEWVVRSVPPMVLILVLTTAALAVFRLLVRKLRQILIRRAGGESCGHERLTRIETLTAFLRKAGSIALWTVAGLELLREAGVEIGPILAGAGILGLAVGFGAQSLIKDVISGFFLLMEDQARVGDVVAINGTGGMVEAINLRTIVLRDLSGVVHIFPHGQVNTLSNMTKEWSAMVFDVNVTYGEDTDRATRVIEQTAEDLRKDSVYADRILSPVEIFGVDRFADSSVVIKARIRTKPLEQWAVGREFNRRLKKAFDAGGIEFPFPTMTIVQSPEKRAPR
jgi:small-conductance mechanosensitive channel